jgi:hypothetical protein
VAAFGTRPLQALECAELAFRPLWVVFELESIDRLYLNVYVPRLQREGGVASFFRFHRGHRFATSALMDPISKDFVARLESFAKELCGVGRGRSFQASRNNLIPLSARQARQRVDAREHRSERGAMLRS